MKIEMAIYKSRFACIVSTLVAAMFLSACGLKDDLYIPTEETEAPTAETQTTEEANTDEENDGENPGPLSTTAP
jgi:predicted small lipoprotein YifL